MIHGIGNLCVCVCAAALNRFKRTTNMIQHIKKNTTQRTIWQLSSFEVCQVRWFFFAIKLPLSSALHTQNSEYDYLSMDTLDHWCYSCCRFFLHSDPSFAIIFYRDRDGCTDCMMLLLRPVTVYTPNAIRNRCVHHSNDNCSNLYIYLQRVRQRLRLLFCRCCCCCSNRNKRRTEKYILCIVITIWMPWK